MRLTCSLAFAFVMLAAVAACGEDGGSPGSGDGGPGGAGAAGNGGTGGVQGGTGGGGGGNAGAGGTPLVCGVRRLEISWPDRPSEPIIGGEVPVVYSTGTGNYLLHVAFWVQNLPSQLDVAIDATDGASGVIFYRHDYPGLFLTEISSCEATSPFLTIDIPPEVFDARSTVNVRIDGYDPEDHSNYSADMVVVRLVCDPESECP